MIRTKIAEEELIFCELRTSYLLFAELIVVPMLTAHVNAHVHYLPK